MDENGRQITDAQQAFVALLKTDLQLGIATAELAKIDAAAGNQSYKTVRQFLSTTSISAEDRKQIEDDLNKLKEMLAERRSEVRP